MMLHRAFGALLITFVAAISLRAADFTGSWEGLPTLPDGTQFKVTFVFTANDIVAEGDKITFNIATDGGIYYNTGTLNPDGLLVEGIGPDGPLVPLLYQRPAADLAGRWRGKVETPDGPAEIIYTFENREGKLIGTVSGPMGQAPLTQISIDGKRVAFESEYSGFTIKRRGTVTGDTMQLTISIDGNELSATFARDLSAAPGK